MLSSQNILTLRIIFFTIEIFCKIKTFSTGKSLSEALMFASIHPQYDNRLFKKLPWKLQVQNMGRTCSAYVLSMFSACSFHGNSMNNLLSFCGLLDARISASEKNLPVQIEHDFNCAIKN